MKILIVNTYDLVGGAARAAYRLHQGLQIIGLDSKMLVQRKTNDDYTIISPINKYQKALFRVSPYLAAIQLRKYKNKSLFSPAWLPYSRVAKIINELKPDIVHLHWITAGMLSIEELSKIKSPIVWTLHDMWPFTGGCHYDDNCEKYKNGCGKCPILNSSITNDLSTRVFKRKKKAFSMISNITVIGVSKWLAKCAQDSMLFNGKRVINLSNPIDVNYYKPLDKKIAREMLKLPYIKKIVLFGAINATTDRRKGYDALSDALKKVKTENIELAVFGASGSSSSNNFNFPVHYLGSFHDDISLRVLYSAADVMVVPSIQEAFGQTASEAMACGTPVVAFNATGLKDIVDHLINGYLAIPYEPLDLAKGLKWVLDHHSPQELSIKARQKVLDCFEMEKVAHLYKKLYEEILDNKH